MVGTRTIGVAAGVAAACGAAVVFVSLATDTPSPSSTPPEPVRAAITRADPDDIVRAHNAWRSRAGALSLRWAPDLASQAHDRAGQLASQGCGLEHGMLADDVGENLYRASPLRAEGRQDERLVVTPAQVVGAWAAESADYDPASGSCAPGRQCGHYTQLVWPSTEEVGCGMAICPSLAQIWVCRYRPAGNIRVLR